MTKQPFPENITFDDVLLEPRKSSVVPKDVDVSTKLTKNISLNIPLVSSPMDTVTESRLAIALALEGGIGIIHKNIDPAVQAEEVAKVKRFRNGFIDNPVTLSPSKKIKEVVEIRQNKGYKNIPIVDRSKKLLGLITKFDYFWPEDENKSISKLMKQGKGMPTAPANTTLKQAYRIIKEKRVPALLLIDRQGILKSMVSRSDLEKNLTFPLATKDKCDRLRVGAAVSVGKNALDRAKLLVEAGVDVIVVDTAHGHSQNVINTIIAIKKKYSGVDVIGGNVATAQGAKDLITAGADAVKVGVGSGSICTTRVISGVGTPQMSAVLNAVAGREKSGVPVISDGGVKYSGDIVKALAAGADSVMIGNLFAATEESPGETVYYNGRMYKVYRGMGSLEAMQQGSQDRYAQTEQTDSSKLVPEGIVGQTLYKGKLADIVYQFIGGVRSGMGYVGARNLKQLRDKAQFIKITPQSLKESHPHDITITKEAPNYYTPNS